MGTDAMKLIHHYSGRHALLLGHLVLHAQWLFVAACIASDNCDPGLKPAGGIEVGYTNRGDRCEGVYVQEVSGGALDIISLTTDFQNFRFTKENPLRLEWPTVGDDQVQVRASSVRRKLYYRMDTIRPQKPPNFIWPSDILSRLELGREEIGLLAWTEQPVGGAIRKIYLPMRVTAQESNHIDSAVQQQTGDSYKVVLISSVELQEVYVTLRPLDSKGKLGKPIRQSLKLDYGFYPAERPIVFRLSFSELTNSPSGLYSLSVGAELKNGEPRVAPEVWFFHPSPDKSRSPSAGGKP